MRIAPLAGLVVVASLSMSGCIRFKGVEAFNTATTPVKYTSSLPADRKWNGDAYGLGGEARGSGGTNTKTTYGEGADPASTAPVNGRLDQPEKGVGKQAGEYHQDHVTGYGLTNSPISQSTPSDANSLAGRTAP
jgi:hypothetical protein